MWIGFHNIIVVEYFKGPNNISLWGLLACYYYYYTLFNLKLLSRAGLSHSAGQLGHMASGGYLSTAVKQMLISCVYSEPLQLTTNLIRFL
jgi:hypothetical protein